MVCFYRKLNDELAVMRENITTMTAQTAKHDTEMAFHKVRVR